MKKLKRISVCLHVFLMFSVSCTEDKKPFASAVSFENIEIERKSSDTDSTFKVSIKYCNPLDAPQYLKDSIMKHTKLLFASWFRISDRFDIDESVKNYMDECVSHMFRLEIFPENVCQNSQTVSFTYSWFADEGNVHRNFGKYCFVLSKKDGSRLAVNSLLANDKSLFLKYAESEFKRQSGMKPDEDMYELYEFENKIFRLSDTFAFTDSALVFYYNPCDIAPYSAGLITLILPLENIENFTEYCR